MITKLALANVRRSYKDFAIYFCTLVFGVALFYAFNTIQEQQAMLSLTEQQNSMIELLSILINGVSVFIIAILGFLVIYANRFLVRRRNNEFALYQLLGMPKATLMRLLTVETFFVGGVSLIVGLAIGFVLSLALLYATSLLFVAEIPGFALFFSEKAALLTIIAFVVMFVISLLLSIRFIARARIIDLIKSESKNDTYLVKSLPLTALLFCASVALIGSAYAVLVNNGFVMNGNFALATGMMIVGTFLFFYSAAGFLLRFLQNVKGFYWKGLNAFTLRQIASRINTTFVSLTVICLTLFLALTSVSTGIGVASSVQSGISAPYSASVSSTFTNYAYTNFAHTDPDSLTSEQKKRFDAAKATYEHNIDVYKSYNGDMAAALESHTAQFGAPAWNTMVAGQAQVDLYDTYTCDYTWANFEQDSGLKLSDYASEIESNYGITSLSVIKLSQYNAARELAGQETITLDPSQAMMLVDLDLTKKYIEDASKRTPTLHLWDSDLTLAPTYIAEPFMTQAFPSSVGTLIVPDDAIPASEIPINVVLDVQYVDDGVEGAFSDYLDAFTDAVRDTSNDAAQSDLWPVSLTQTRQQVFDQSVGFSTIIAYLAIYIGFVLVVACAAILALQQLTSASDNRKRYELLNKLGAQKHLLNASLAKQIGLVFLAPVIVAVAHTLCAMSTIVPFISIFGHMDILSVSLITGVVFLIVYGVYYLITYFSARSIINQDSAGQRL